MYHLEARCPICDKKLILSGDHLECSECGYKQARTSFFCPNCKSMLIPSGWRKKCNKCGYSTTDVVSEQSKKVEKIKNISPKNLPDIVPFCVGVQCPNCKSLRTFRKGTHAIPNADFEAILPAVFMKCQDCRYEWEFRYG